MLITFNCEQCHLIESYINLSSISGVLVNRMPGIILCIIKNNCLVIKSVALRKKLSPLSPPLMPQFYWDWNPEASTSLSAVYADWSTPGHSYGCPLFDMATGSRRGFSPLTVEPIVHHQETLDGQAMSCCSSRSPTFSLLPPHHPPTPCCHLTYSPTRLASPRLPNHYDTLSEWLQMGQVFSGGWKQRERAPRCTDGQREGGRVCH